MRVRFTTRCILFATALLLGCATLPLLACTGITLRATDGSVMFARTMEWGTFDLRSNLVIIPRGYSFTSDIGEGQSGVQWKAKFGAVGLDFLGRDNLIDGMNERGLTVNLFYLIIIPATLGFMGFFVIIDAGRKFTGSKKTEQQAVSQTDKSATTTPETQDNEPKPEETE